MGADGVLVVVPYYNKPPQRGLFEHFKQVASSINIPTILYNVPSRTITALELDTIKKLSAHPSIVGIKKPPEILILQKLFVNSVVKLFYFYLVMMELMMILKKLAAMALFQFHHTSFQKKCCK